MIQWIINLFKKKSKEPTPTKIPKRQPVDFISLVCMSCQNKFILPSNSVEVPHNRQDYMCNNCIIARFPKKPVIA